MGNIFRILILISFATNAIAVSNYKGHNYSIQNSFDHNKAELTHLEKKIAGNFHKLFKLSRAGVINKRLLKNLLVDLKKSNTFYSYIVWPKSLLQIEDTKTTSALNKLCEQISNKNNQSEVARYLSRSAEKICYKKLLKTLSDLYNRKSLTNKTYLAYFTDNIDSFLDHSMETELKYFLSRFKSNSGAHKAFSKELSQHYMGQKIIPSKKLIPYMDIDIEFTSYIQSVDLDKKSNEQTFLRSFRKLAKESLALADKGATKVEINEKTLKMLSFVNATFKRQNQEKLLNSLISYGKSLSRRKYFKSSRLIFSRILEQPSSHYNKAVFEQLWTYISNKEYEEGLEAISKYTKETDLSSDSKMSFWIAYSYHYSNRENRGKKIFKELISENPLSYYAILAAKLISEDKEGKDTKSVYLSYLTRNTHKQTINTNNFDHRWLKRVMAWGRVYNPALLNLELAEISKRKLGTQLETHLLSAAYRLSEEKNYLESFKIIYRHVDKGVLGVNTEVLKLLFPLPYLKEVINKSKDFDPIIAMSLIRQESGFNRFAKSRVGARGLMQLMPRTAKRFKRRVSKKQLYNSNLNISIGTKYFQKLLKMFDNNLVYSLAAYNAGEGRISDWKERDYVNSEDSMLQNIENIPFLETRKYVKLIFRNIFFYKMLTEEPIMKDTFKFNKIYDIHVGFNK